MNTSELAQTYPVFDNYNIINGLPYKSRPASNIAKNKILDSKADDQQ